MRIKNRMNRLEREMNTTSNEAEHAAHAAWYARFCAASPENRETTRDVVRLKHERPQGPNRDDPDEVRARWLEMARRLLGGR